ncbi:MAG: KR domain-containing protein [Symploca sp. SIO2C1]|nr:KR domain-containing protein [Symploca sp. SIO2C1]
MEIPPKISLTPQESKISEGKKPDIADWFYRPLWQPSIIDCQQEENFSTPILVFVDQYGLGSRLVEQLETKIDPIISSSVEYLHFGENKAEGRGQKAEGKEEGWKVEGNDNCLTGDDIIIVKVGENFSQLDSNLYRINPNNRADYQTLIQALQVQNLAPKTIVHLWNVTANQETDLTLESVEIAQNLGFYSLLYLTQALGEQSLENEIAMLVVYNHLQNVTGEEIIAPEKATLIGPVRVIPQEYSNINCRSVDVVLPPSGSQDEEKLVSQLLNELQHKSEDTIIAYRNHHRWVQTFEPVRLEQPSKEKLPFKSGGVYLLTGGLGGIGLVFAEHLAKTVQAKLILTGRSTLPQRHQWEQWLTDHSEENLISSKIRKVKHLEELGAEVLVVPADVANLQQMSEAISLAQHQFGEINGVIHSAGVPGGGVIQLKTREIADAVLAPKVQGTAILEILLKDVELDFMVVCSSMESPLGHLGQVDYCGANNFLDAYAHSKSADSNRLTVSINWDAWQEVGMAAKALQQGSKLVNLDEGILPQEGVDVLNRILNSSESQIMVCTQDIQYPTV